ncbi:hypothetical protein KSH_09250 (plasmid) [Moraxella osloensis]|nr:hypothetical protein KSH_09250 [Moraxella osloensis]
MLKVAWYNSVLTINTVINEPVLFGLRIDIDTVNDADAFNNAMGVATVLAINQFDFVTMIFIEYAVIKDKIAIVV